MIFNKRILLFLFLFGSLLGANAQNKPIGYWNAMLPYDAALGVATDGITVYTITKQAFFTYNAANGQIDAYSKVDGMADVGMQSIGYDMATSTAVLIYSNGNIDLFKDNTFFNIPDFKLKTIAGSKVVYNVYTENGKAYLASSQGILVIDLVSQSIAENYQFYVGSQLLSITGFTGAGDYFYAITSNGVYRALKSNPELQNFQVWQRVNATTGFNSITAVNNQIFLCDTSFVYNLTPDTLVKVYTTPSYIMSMSPGYGRLFINEYNFHTYIGDTRSIDSNFHVFDSFFYHDQAKQTVQILDSNIWMANYFDGLAQRTDTNKIGYYSPQGPNDASNFDIYANNRNVWVAHGGYSDNFTPLGNTNGMSNYKNGSWVGYRQDANGAYPPFADSMNDLVAIVKDEVDTIVYAGSFEGGLFELHADGSYKIYKQNVFDISITNVGNKFYQVNGLALDANQNLWVTLMSASHELYVKEKATGNWYKFNPGPNVVSYGGEMTIDNSGDVWYVSPLGGGVVGYSANNTFSDPTDDYYTHLVNGVGQGNLPSAVALCVAHDYDDNLWIGTSDGIGILYNASGCLSQHCDAEIPIVQYDQYAGYLFKGENVRTIAVDGANRKWVGTDNGVWLLSPDAGNSKIIYRFTVDNSPLPSNHIQKIAVDNVTGDVYIGTDQGLMSYRSTATEGGATNSNVLTFPNPVPSGYKGTIAIKGLVANADVRITDINGQLVYRTTALGGQAVWNGLDYKGHRPASGVYLIFASSADGAQTYSGKMVFMN